MEEAVTPIPADKKGQPILPGDVVQMMGRVERTTREGIFVKVRDGLVVYLESEAVEVVK